MERATRFSPPWPEHEAAYDHDQVIVLRGVPWAQYDALLRARGDAPKPRMAYLDGVLQIMTTSLRHEIRKKLLARLVETYAEERDVALNGMGQTTFRKKAKQAGLEPDECYCIGRVRSIPDFAIEIVITSGGVDKLEIYRRLGVREVWFWIDDRIWVYVVSAGRFERCSRSAALPELDLDALGQLVTSTRDSQQTQAVRNYRRTLARRR